MDDVLRVLQHWKTKISETSKRRHKKDVPKQPRAFQERKHETVTLLHRMSFTGSLSKYKNIETRVQQPATRGVGLVVVFVLHRLLLLNRAKKQGIKSKDERAYNIQVNPHPNYFENPNSKVTFPDGGAGVRRGVSMRDDLLRHRFLRRKKVSLRQKMKRKKPD